MKKLLVLLMVLGLATSAQAALSISLSETTVLTGDTVTASVVSSDNGNWIGYFILSEDQVMWTDPVAADYSGSWTTSGIGNLGYVAAVPGYSAVYDMSAASNLQPTDVVAGTQFSISIVGQQIGTIYLGMADADYNPIAGTLTSLVVVPEPMTIALLGLGGLFLRRRK